MHHDHAPHTLLSVHANSLPAHEKIAGFCFRKDEQDVSVFLEPLVLVEGDPEKGEQTTFKGIFLAANAALNVYKIELETAHDQGNDITSAWGHGTLPDVEIEKSASYLAGKFAAGQTWTPFDGESETGATNHLYEYSIDLSNGGNAFDRLAMSTRGRVLWRTMALFSEGKGDKMAPGKQRFRSDTFSADEEAALMDAQAQHAVPIGGVYRKWGAWDAIAKIFSADERTAGGPPRTGETLRMHWGRSLKEGAVYGRNKIY